MTSFMNSLISPTRHAVTRVDSFTGLGNEPSATLRHKVAGLNGKIGAGSVGCESFDSDFFRFELLTSCDSRRNALSGNLSKDVI